MNNEKKDLPKTEFAYVDDVLSVNFNPHPFMIGAKHVAYASDHCGGFLGQDVLDKFPCAMQGCGQHFDSHTYDYVACVKLSRDCTQGELREWLKELAKEGGWHQTYNSLRKIDGFVFVRTEFKVLE